VRAPICGLNLGCVSAGYNRDDVVSVENQCSRVLPRLTPLAKINAIFPRRAHGWSKSHFGAAARIQFTCDQFHFGKAIAWKRQISQDRDMVASIFPRQ